MFLQMLFVIMILITEAGFYALYVRTKRRAEYEAKMAELLKDQNGLLRETIKSCETLLDLVGKKAELLEEKCFLLENLNQTTISINKEENP